MAVSEMFSSPSVSHRMINLRQMGTALDLMAHHSQRSGDATPAYFAAADQAVKALEPAYAHEVSHRNRDRNPFGVTAMTPETSTYAKHTPDIDGLVGQHQSRHGDYTLTVMPYSGGEKSHQVLATHPSSAEPVGVLHWNPHGGEVEWAHVKDEHQRQGVASAMVKAGREAASMTPRMASPLPSPELSTHGLGLSRGILNRGQMG